jgi:L-asparaginase/Glu-tRNA(Gln) amidotransferase subunit D
VRVTQTNGTILTREITGGSEIDIDNEQLNIDVAWGSTITLAEIARIDFYEKVRIDSDKIQITHLDGQGSARILFPVKAVFE